MPTLVKPVRIPSYRRHKPSGQAVVTLAGRDVYLGEWKSAGSRRQYERLLAEWLATGSSRAARQRDSLSVQELAAAYRMHLERAYQQTTLPSFKTALGRLRRLYGDVSSTEFGPVQLKVMRGQFVREP